MDLEALIESTSQGSMRLENVQACASALGVSIGDVLDRFARVVAQRYLQGQCCWEVGDTAANHLFAFAMSANGGELSPFAWEVFLAFDAGEYPPGPDYEARTRALLEAAVSASGTEDAGAADERHSPDGRGRYTSRADERHVGRTSTSCDFGVWWPSRELDDAAAGKVYVALCEGDTTGVEPSPAIDDFYRELTSMHPEIDDVPEGDVDNVALCPWSIAFDRSPGHVIMSCVWSKAEYVEKLIKRLASKHGLAVFDPQAERIVYPGKGATRRSSATGSRRPWWRFW